MPGSQAALQYRLHAQHCLEIAADLSDHRERLMLVDMAQAWANLAEQAEKTAMLDLVYETPGNTLRADASPQRSDGTD